MKLRINEMNGLRVYSSIIIHYDSGFFVLSPCTKTGSVV